MPTPDPTIASCISDEDVARQLIALGDASNFSHGRASASTAADDALSGIADVASSTGATSDGESGSEDEALPQYPNGLLKRHRQSYASDSDDPSGDDDYRDSEAMIKSEFDEYDRELPKAKRIKTKASSTGPEKPRSQRTESVGKKLPSGQQRQSQGPKKARTSASTSQNESAPRKASSVSATGTQPLGPDEEDLSAKPRCQRCRKSKKGCDRQRPCQRCKDAGIGVDGCISEDEGNGRKGRYGRHMGVAIKKSADIPNAAPSMLHNTTEADDFHTVGAILTGMAAGEGLDKNKKRKR